MLKKLLAGFAIGVALTVAAAAVSHVFAQTTNSISKPRKNHAADTYTTGEILSAGHSFFGKASRELAGVVNYVFEEQGEPTAYIVGEEGSGAFIGGLRYGEGTIYYKDGTRQKIYWQGPSVGYDFGGNGSRAMVLVYNSTHPRDLYHRFGGVDGSAYFIGGLGVNFQKRDDIVLAPIRAGVGLRLGANVGYLKYSGKPHWNPF